MPRTESAKLAKLLEQLHSTNGTRGAAIAGICAMFEPLVRSMAQRYWQPTADREDLEQEARRGLLEACETFDRAKGAFPTHARWGIRSALTHFVEHLQNPVRLPFPLPRRMTQLRRVALKLSHELQREPTTAELSEAMKLSEAKIAAILSYAAGPSSETELIETATPESILIEREDFYNALRAKGEK